jgi:hypothetical protein
MYFFYFDESGSRDQGVAGSFAVDRNGTYGLGRPQTRNPPQREGRMMSGWDFHIEPAWGTRRHNYKGWYAGCQCLSSKFSSEEARSRVTDDCLRVYLSTRPKGNRADLMFLINGVPVAILDALDRKIALHRQKRAVLEELFRSLLHKLMTGAIRVADLDLSALPTNLS